MSDLNLIHSVALAATRLCRALFTLASSSAILAAAPATTDPTELSFGVISTESAVGLREGFEPFLEQLSRTLGMKVKGFYASDYTGVIEAMRFGRVHVAWMGAQAAIHAVDRAGAEVIAQTTGSGGRTGYASLLIVHQRSPYTEIESLIANAKTLTFGNGDPLSTTGYLLPNYHLWAPRGMDPRRAFKQTRNANHEANALAVIAGHVDVATNNTESLERLRQRQPAAAAKLRVIWTSPEIPTDPIVCRRELSRELKTRLQAALLAFGRIGSDAAKEQKLLLAISDGWGPFLASDHRQLLPLRRMEIERDRAALEHGERFSATEKAQRLATLHERQRKLQEFETLSNYWNSVKETK